MPDSVFKNILMVLIVALVVVQLYRNFGPLLDDHKQMIRENLVSLLTMAAAVFAYRWIA